MVVPVEVVNDTAVVELSVMIMGVVVVCSDAGEEVVLEF